ncbi:MAG: hypothetical protein ACLT98_07790 [Eggerthellaceae bacterium]
MVNCGVEQVLFARPHRALPAIHPHRPRDPESEEAVGEHHTRRWTSFHSTQSKRPCPSRSSRARSPSSTVAAINGTILTIARHRAGRRAVDDDLPARELPQMEGDRSAMPCVLHFPGRICGRAPSGSSTRLEMCSFTCGSTHLTYFSHEAGVGVRLFSIDAQFLPPDAAHPCRRARRINLRRARAGCAFPDLPPQAGDGRTRPRGL